MIFTLLRLILGEEKFEYCRYIKKKIQYSKRNSNKYCSCCKNHIKYWYSFSERQWNDSYNSELFEPQYDICACPICGSVPRQRIEAKWLETQQLDNKRVLLWAPENSMKMYFSKTKTELITADLYDNTVMQKENMEASSFEDKEFDFIICNHVLEHVSDVKAALGDTYRILKDDGIALFTVPLKPGLNTTFEDKEIISEDDRRKLYGQADHVRLFGKDITNYFVEAGFLVTEYLGDVEGNKEILPIVAPSKYDSNTLYICKK